MAASSSLATRVSLTCRHDEHDATRRDPASAGGLFTEVPGSRVLGSLYPASCIIPSNRNKGTLMTPCSTEATGLDIVVLHNLSVGWMIRRRGITRTTQTMIAWECLPPASESKVFHFLLFAGLSR